ncbi:redoxin domain-containing protein [Lysinibacillus sp. FSL H8-0500]|uniref:redoxin domain-containing protein n=1 Tax=Lysinibacillus sp. FSL H8-0500 TaxID=2921393 RepID=UPI00310195B0
MHAKSFINKALILILFFTMIYIVVQQIYSQPNTTLTTDPEGVAVNFTLSDLQGKQHSLIDYVENGLIVNFWATSCPPCEREFPVLEKAYQNYKNQGVEVLAINVEEPMRIVTPFISEKNSSFPILLDRRGKVSSAYQVLNLPITFFINENGEIVEKVSGELTEVIIRKNIEKMTPSL